MLVRLSVVSVAFMAITTLTKRIPAACHAARINRMALAAMLALSVLAGGLAGAMIAAPAAGAQGTWQGPINVYSQYNMNTEAQGFVGMSCPASNLCFGLDSAGYLTTYDGTKWSEPTSIDSEVNGNGSGAESISCPTTTFCMAVDSMGYAIELSGGTWSSPGLIDGGGSSNGGANAVVIDSVSCSSATFCAAVDRNGYAMTYDGTTWTAPSFVDNTGTSSTTLLSVSCVSSTRCIATDAMGDVLQYDGSAWSAPASVDSGAVESVSCPTPLFCVAVDYIGDALTFDGTAWTTPATVVPGNEEELAEVSCASPKFCVAGTSSAGGTYAGNVFSYDGTSWSAAVPVDTSATVPNYPGPGNLTTISCPSIAFCAAGDDGVGGNIFVYTNTDTVPGAPTNVIAEPGDAQADLTWDAPTSQGACAITSYTIDTYTGSTLVTTVQTGSTATTYTVTGLTNGTKYTFTVAATNCDGTGPPSTASEPIIPSKPTTPAPYNALSPYRICDTRPGNPSELSGNDAQCLGKTVAGGTSLTIGVAGTNPTGTSSGGVPATGATAVVLTVTATGGTSGGYLTVYPAGSEAPLASNLNYTPGASVPNLVEVALGTGGQVAVFNSTGKVDVLVDVEGYVGPGPAGAGLFNPLTPARICDTRPGNPSGLSTPPENQCNTLGPRAGGTTSTIEVTGGGGVPSTGAEAVALNVTVTGTTASGWLAVWPAGTPRPVTSNLNWQPGQTVPDRVVVPVGTGGEVSLYLSNGTANVLVDVGGWYTAAGGTGASLTQFSGITPARICDTRSGSGEPNAGKTLSPGSSLAVQVRGVGGVPANATAVVLNVTVTSTTSAGYLTAWPTGAAQPTASDLNWARGETVPNLVIVEIGSAGQVSFFNASGSADVIADVVGWYQ